MNKQIGFFCLFFIAPVFAIFVPTIKWKEPETRAIISFVVPIGPEDALYKEYIDFSCDQEWVSITDWTTDIDAISVYDPVFKESKKIYIKDVTFNVSMHIQRTTEEAALRFTYYRKAKGCIEEAVLKLPFLPHMQKPLEPIETTVDIKETQVEQLEDIVPTNNAQQNKQTWSCTISDLIKHTKSVWLRTLLILLLGALLSLTPCIYPLIPITVGILQGQGSTSIWRNLLLSLCYTIGIATTFALLGLTAAYTGKLFGSFMQHPIVIFAIVALLIYLAGSMLDFYRLYIPALLQTQKGFAIGGSPITVFLFGLVSGTVASPCVSPGLALVLSIVAGLAHPLMGFMLLFAFGIGLSLPLLIIGTFSSSLSMLPQAGSWMVEIKKLFGFLLLGMCIYFLSIISPPVITAWLIVLLMLSVGLYYLYSARKRTSMAGKLIYNLLAIGLITASIIASYFAIKATYDPGDCTIIGLWTDNYTCALEQARHEGKKLLVKIEAPCCPLCNAIDKKFFQNKEIINLLDMHYVPVRINGGDSTDPMVAEVITTFNVIGFPTILLIDPQEQTTIQSWGSELYDYSIEQLKEMLLNEAQ